MGIVDQPGASNQFYEEAQGQNVDIMGMDNSGRESSRAQDNFSVELKSREHVAQEGRQPMKLA
jgi:hypothetical protein